MRKNIVTGLIRFTARSGLICFTARSGLICFLSFVPACTTDKGDTDSTTGSGVSASTSNASSDSTETGTGTGTGTTTPTTTEMCPDPTEQSMGSVMDKFGAPCETDADCSAVLGPEGKCLKDILMLYGLPGGYCSLLCDLPPGVGYVEDDMTCGQGVTCIGADGYFEGCVVECFDDSQCPREGYECRVMPQIGQPCDQKFCLMTDENML